MSSNKQLLVEIRTEELPPAQLWRLADSFPDALLAALQKEGFANEESTRAKYEHREWKKLATPRRLVALLLNINAELPPQEIVRRGPQVSACKDKEGAPTKALIGFMQSVGATCEKDLTTTTEKGKEYIAWRGKTAARNLADELAAIVERVLLSLPAPRLMRWGANEFKFIRPVRGVLMLHGKKHISGNVMGIAATKTTRGHPFMSEGDVKVADVDSYVETLKEHGVIVDMRERLETIAEEIEKLANKQGGPDPNPPAGVTKRYKFLALGDSSEPYSALSLIQSMFYFEPSSTIGGSPPPSQYSYVSQQNELLREVCAMCENPVVHERKLDEQFKHLPWRCIVECMQKHQRFIPLIPVEATIRQQSLSEKISDNLSAVDWREKPFYYIVSDNAPEAKNKDVMLNNYDSVLRARLSDVLFYYEKDKQTPQHVYAEELKNIVFYQKLGSQHDRIGRVFDVFATLKGKHDDQDRMKAEAFQASLPTQMVDEYPNLQAVMSSQYFGHSEKDMRLFAMFYGLDKMVGLFGAGAKPTSSKDPHGLRKAAMDFVEGHFQDHFKSHFASNEEGALTKDAIRAAVKSFSGKINDVTEEVYDFCLDRFRFFMSRYEGTLQSNRNVQESVLSSKPHSFRDAYARITAIGWFNTKPASETLAAANKRINNIFRKSKVNTKDLPSFNAELMSEDSERELSKKLEKTIQRINEAPNAEKHQKFSNILDETATLAPAVDAFFDNVLVNHEDEKIRLNRFALLAELRKLLNTVGDLSYLAK